MTTQALILGFWEGSFPRELRETLDYDGERISSESVNEVAAAAQLEALQEAGFVLLENELRGFCHFFKMRRGDLTVCFWKMEFDVFNHVGRENITQILGFGVAMNPWGRLINWELEATPGFLITAEKLQVVENFKAKIVAKYPSFAGAQLYATDFGFPDK